jgi:hypothetical protein
MKCKNCEGGGVFCQDLYVISHEMAMDAQDMSLEGYQYAYEHWATCPCCGGDWEDCKNCEEIENEKAD